MNEIFEIKKPESETNKLTLTIKYIVLFIVLFCASWFVLPFLISKDRPTRADNVFESMIDNPILYSLLIAVGIISWFVYRTKKKYELGEVFKIEFLKSEGIARIHSVNTMNGVEKIEEYKLGNLDLTINKKEDALFGKQRVLIGKNQGEKVLEINIERTGWIRNDQIESLMEKVKN